MTTPTALREALAEALIAVPGLRVTSVVPGAPNPPIAVVGQWVAEYDQTLNRGFDRYRFTVRLLVAPSTDRAAQEHLDSYLASSGSSSVKAALEADQTLGGVASTVRVVRVGPVPQVFDLGAQSYLGADVEVEVLARGA